MRTATFPVVRTTPETRALVESTLRPGETLSTFIEESVRIAKDVVIRIQKGSISGALPKGTLKGLGE